MRSAQSGKMNGSAEEPRSAQSHILYKGVISGSSFTRMYIAWYDFRILYRKKVYAWYDFRILYRKKVYCLVWFQNPLCKKVYCLVWFQGPPSQESVLSGMISESFTIRKYMAWYDFRTLCHKKVVFPFFYSVFFFFLFFCFLFYMPGMISGSCTVRKYTAWYDFRILYYKKVYCLV